MNIYLLTHQRELSKKTNTGFLIFETLGTEAKVIVWDRVNPDPELLKVIDNGSAALLYPSDESEPISSAADYHSYIIIDGTWQEARKIYNRSSYLKDLPSVKIQANKSSTYNLRRNQRKGGLCTAECAIEILNTKGLSKKAVELQTNFLTHLASLQH